MVSILKDFPIDGVKIVPCPIAMPNRGVVKSFLVAGEGRVILVDTARRTQTRTSSWVRSKTWVMSTRI